MLQLVITTSVCKWNKEQKVKIALHLQKWHIEILIIKTLIVY